MLRAVTVRISDEELRALDALAQLYGSRSAAVRVLIRDAALASGAAAPQWEKKLDGLRVLLEGVRRELAGLRAQVKALSDGGTLPEALYGNASRETEEAVDLTLGALLSFDKSRPTQGCEYERQTSWEIGG